MKKIWLWHRRLGHVSFGYLRKLLPSLFHNVKDSEFKCSVCILAKSHRVPYPLSLNKSMIPFALIHSDVWGPSPVTTYAGIRWFVTFVDDCTRMTWLYVMKHKSDVGPIFRVFHKMIQTLFSLPSKVFRSDNGGEYINSELSQFFQDIGMIHETSCSQTPEQNGVAECKNRHILEVARTLLIGASVPKQFWADAVIHAIYLMNRMPSRTLDFHTPLEALAHHVPLSSIVNLTLRIFGCVAYVHLHKNQRSKLDPCALRCVFLGFAPYQKGYRCYHPPTRRFYVTMDVTFLEHELFFYPTLSNQVLPGELRTLEEPDWFEVTLEDREGVVVFNKPMATEPEPSSSIPVTASTSHEDTVTNIAQPVEPTAVPLEVVDSPSLVPAHAPMDFPEVSDLDINIFPNPNIVDRPYQLPPRQNRGHPPDRFSPEGKTRYSIAQYVSTHRLSPQYQAFVNQMTSVKFLNSVEEALKDSKWIDAMNIEMAALQKNETWDVVSLPHGKKPVGCRWVFTIKHKADGTIDRYKARLVAKGYTQTYGVDYRETFAPVAKMNTIRVLLSLAANLNWPLKQFDVKNAFLHGDLEEEVYMDFPPGYGIINGSGKVCKLRKALYGLKQSPRAWFGRFTNAMKKYGYHQGNSDHTLFIKKTKDGKITLLVIYVDDMVVTGDDTDEIQKLQGY